MNSPQLPVVSEPQPPVPQPEAAVPETRSPQFIACANCGVPLSGEYCTACGQRHEPHVHSVGHFFSEAFKSITHADSRLWRTLGYLLAKPGRLTHDFFEGKRARYLPPFRLYLVISVVFFLIANLPGRVENPGDFIQIDPPASPEGVAGMKQAADKLEANLGVMPGARQAAEELRAQAARDQAALDNKSGAEVEVEGLQDQNAFTEFCKEFSKPDPRANKNYAKMHQMCLKTAEDHGKALLDAIVNNIPRAMFILLPLLAIFMKPLYWRPKRYYVEHLLFLVHNHAFVFLALSIVGLVGLIPMPEVLGNWIDVLLWVYMIYYIFRAMRVYYAQSRALTFAKYMFLGLVYISTSFLVLLLTALYSAMTL